MEDLHGTKVADPYRWLEDPDSKETQQCMSQLLHSAHAEYRAVHRSKSSLSKCHLHNVSSDCGAAVVSDQNKLTSSVLSQCETRTQFNELLTELFDYPRYSCPRRHGKRSAMKCTESLATDKQAKAYVRISCHCMTQTKAMKACTNSAAIAVSTTC